VEAARVDEVVAALEAGAVVVLPTDTVYGLVALARDEAATAALFALKGRSHDVPLAVLCASVEQALALAEPSVGPAVEAVAARWWPGPLTLVLPRRTGVELHLGDPAHTVGLRVPDHDLVRAIAARVGPLAATSANRHGSPVAETAAAAAAALGPAVALVVDGGTLGERSSTVVDATSWPWVVLRVGPIAGDEILAVAGAADGPRG
jgi:L-threonylcarbamoyladenylate synthase